MIAIVALLILTSATPALAGGSWLEPSAERVEVDETIRLSGDVSEGQLGWVEDGPYYAYMWGENYGTILEEAAGGWVTDVPLGQLEIEADDGWAQVSLEFAVPADVPPGEYWIYACNDPCTTGFGDLIGAVLYVGVDPPSDVDSPGLAATAPTVAPSATVLALVPHSGRSTGLNAAWVAISAGLAIVVLLSVFVARDRARN